MNRITPALPLYYLFPLLGSLVFFSCQKQVPHANALIHETSPYLLQHAHNPVDWYPWGEEALEKAQQEDKLLLISIGYAACHWCHVMERESFEDTVVANRMNRHFVSVKVDREERPDIDAIYMDACQLATGEACGWPLNVFALPDGRPVWAGTYFRKKNWLEILDYFAQVYQNEPEKLETYAAQLLQGIQTLDSLPTEVGSASPWSFAQLRPKMNNILVRMDTVYGGRSGAPKFPSPNLLELLLQWHFYTGDKRALQAVETSLKGMARGGIYDQLAGGFARYSVDNQWKVPHFEKMLYDNAQLVSLYAQAYALTGKKDYAERVKETLAFVEQTFRDPSGGFYSSLNADSEGEEGLYYIWTQTELEGLLPDNEWRALFFDFYQIQPEGNWEDRKNILYRQQSLAAFAERRQVNLTELESAFKEMEAILLAARSQRTAPTLDDKILLSWNALMLSGYLDAYRYLGDDAYLEIALQNADFLLDNYMQENGRLYRSYKEGKVSINAFLDDYAFLAQALIRLYEVTFDSQWLDQAQRLVEYVDEYFWDAGSSTYFYTSDLDPELITRKRILLDNVRPAANSVLAEVLYDLSLLLYEQAYEDRAQKILNRIITGMEAEDPFFLSNWLQLYLRMVEAPFEVAIVGPDYQALQMEMMSHYLPNALFLGGAQEGQLELLQQKLQGEATYIYVCKNKVCRLPVQEVGVALEQLDHINSISSSSKMR
jgi:uncharacterized protein YyaL (SSP411 family)